MWPGHLDIKRLSFLFLLTIPTATLGFMPNLAFWKNKAPASWSLKFTTPNQTVYAGDCSGITTVGAYDLTDTLTNVSADVTVNLSGTNTIFYADSYCSQVITSVIIENGTSSKDFYFITTSSGSPSLSAAGTGYSTGSQSQTINPHPFTWTGSGGNALWNNPGNWSGGSVPDNTSNVLFNSSCVSNCSPTVNVDSEVAGLRIATGYSGTITQSAKLTVWASGWIQFAGSFAGNSSEIIFHGPFNLQGGTFTSTSNTLTTGGDFRISGSGNFVPNSGTVVFFKPGTINIGSDSLGNVSIGSMETFNLDHSTLQVNGTLTLNDQASCCGGGVNDGTIVALGDVIIQDFGKNGNAVIKLAGVGAQNLTSTTTGNLPGLEIASTGSVTITGTIALHSNLTYTSGIVNTSSSKFIFNFNSTISPGLMEFQDVSFGEMAGNDFNGETMVVNGKLTFADQAPCCSPGLSNGTILAKGDIDVIDYGKIGYSFLLKIGGSGNQTITGNAGAVLPKLEIASSGGTVTFVDTISFQEDFTYTSGTVNLTSSKMLFYGTSIITPGNLEFNDVNFGGNGSHDLNAGTLRVNGTLTLEDQFSCCSPGLNNGTVLAKGDINLIDFGKTGNALVKVGGNSSQTITGTSDAFIPNLEIASTGGSVNLVGSIRHYGDFTHTSGFVNAGTSTFIFGLNYYLGVTTINPGTVNFNNVTFEMVNHYEINGTVRATGNLLLSGDFWQSYIINSGVIEVAGNYTANNNQQHGLNTSGSASINMVGSTNATLNVVSGALIGGALTINKTGGSKVTLGSNVVLDSSGQNLTVAAGTLDMAGHNLTVDQNISNSGTIRRGTSPSCGTLSYGGSYTGAAAVCP